MAALSKEKGLRKCVNIWRLVQSEWCGTLESPRPLFVAALINGINNILRYQWRASRPDIETSDTGRRVRNAVRQTLRRLQKPEGNGTPSRSRAGDQLQRYFETRRRTEAMSRRYDEDACAA